MPNGPLSEDERPLHEELAELRRTLDLIHDSDMRAIKFWQAAHPDQKNIWPDRAQMIFWLLEDRENIVERCYMAARGTEKLQVSGNRQMYWKGRADAASDVRALKGKL